MHVIVISYSLFEDINRQGPNFALPIIMRGILIGLMTLSGLSLISTSPVAVLSHTSTNLVLCFVPSVDACRRIATKKRIRYLSWSGTYSCIFVRQSTQRPGNGRLILVACFLTYTGLDTGSKRQAPVRAALTTSVRAGIPDPLVSVEPTRALLASLDVEQTVAVIALDVFRSNWRTSLVSPGCLTQSLCIYV